MTRSSFPSLHVVSKTGLFPRALLFREWRQNRWLYGAGLLFMWLPLRAGATTATSLGYGDAHYGWYWSVIVTALGVLTMRLDHAQLWYLLSGPVKRRDLLRVKALFGIAVVVAAFLLPWLWLTLGDLTQQYGPVGSWSPGGGFVGTATHVLAMSALLLTALAATCVAGNLLLAAAGALLVALLPVFASALMSFIDSPSFLGGPVHYSHAFYLIQTTVLSLSPTLATGSGRSAVNWLPFLLWYVVWAAGFWLLGERLWERVPLERLRENLFFPRLRHLVEGGVSVLIAVVAAQLVAPTGNRVVYLFAFAVILAAVWWLIDKWTRHLAMRKAGEPL